MSNATTTQAPPASSGGTPGAAGLTMEQVTAAIEAVFKPLVAQVGDLAKNQKVIADTIAATPAAPATPAASKDDKPKALTADEVDALLTRKLAEAQAKGAKSADRQAFIDTKMKDVPAAYRGKLGDDPAQWAAQEQAIRGEWAADLKAVGFTPPNVGGGAGGAGGTTPAAKAVDETKLSGAQLLSIAVEESAVPSRAAAAADGAAKAVEAAAVPAA
jgi:hypothetical protein